MDSQTQTAVRHLLWIWFQYGGGYKNDKGTICLPHSCMAAGEDAAEFLEGLGLGSDRGQHFELNATGVTVLEG